MPHVFEPAASARSKCRGCGRTLDKGELRFGERLPNPFAEGTELTLWFHPLCSAYKRPESLLESLPDAPDALGDREALRTIAQASSARSRLQRIDGVERARGQATCRQCRAPIKRGDWRIRLTFFEEGRFNPAGFIHVGCRGTYFECDDVLEHALHFSRDLTPEERVEAQAALTR